MNEQGGEIFRKPSGFRWTSTRSNAAIRLAEGYTQVEVAEEVGVSDRTIRSWLGNPEFAEEVDRLSLMVGIANKAFRLRLAKQVIRKLGTETKEDLLAWLKYAQGETDGIKLDLTALLSAISEDET